MSGFFAALLARADGRLPVLERRPRAVFEPAPGAAAAGRTPRRPGRHGDADEDAVAQPWPDAPALAPAPLAGTRAAAGPARDASTMPAAPQVLRWPRPPEATLLAPPRTEHVSPAAAAQPPAPARTTPSGRPAPLPAATHAAADTLPDRGGAARAAAAPAAAPHARPAAAQPTLPHAGATQIDSARTAGARAAAAATPRSAAPPPQRNTTPAVLIAKAHAERGARHESAPAAALAPAPVQISIGRIEIRAVPASAERPRAAGPAAPRLSLDDYLRARHNGSAR